MNDFICVYLESFLFPERNEQGDRLLFTNADVQSGSLIIKRNLGEAYPPRFLSFLASSIGKPFFDQSIDFAAE